MDMVESTDLDDPGSLAELPRGIFTEADRRYLEMDPEERKEESYQYVHNRKTAVGERLGYGIIDLGFGLHNTPHDLRQEAFEDLFESWPMFSPFQLITDCIGFLLLGYMEERGKDLDDEETLEKIIGRSLDRMLWRSDQRVGKRTADVDTEITIDGWMDRDQFDRHMDPADMTEEQLHGMYVMGELTQEEFARAVLSDELD